ERASGLAAGLKPVPAAVDEQGLIVQRNKRRRRRKKTSGAVIKITSPSESRFPINALLIAPVGIETEIGVGEQCVANERERRAFAFPMIAQSLEAAPGGRAALLPLG